MSSNPAPMNVEWRSVLPVLSGSRVTLREPTAADVAPLMDVLSIVDASRFGLELPITEEATADFVAGVQRARSAGAACAFAIVANGHVVGLFHVRRLDPAFEAAEWECTLVPSARGTGVFAEAAQLVGSFVFGVLGTHRIEGRALLNDGRANGAMRKLGAVQEGVLRQAVRRGGEYEDQVLWSVLREDWIERWIGTSPRVH